QALPVASGWADTAIAGWVFGHFRLWMPDAWRDAIGRALGEMTRALRPGGALVVIETLGTGTAEPGPPSDALAEYYGWLAGEHGMAGAATRTDYRFADVEAACATLGFFFGDAFAERVRAAGSPHVPECTGVWSKRVA